MKKILFLITLLLFLTACEENAAPRPSSDSEQSFSANSEIPVDDGVYTIELEIVGDIDSLVRQTQPASGSISGYGSYVHGSYFGPEFGGKGFIRGLVKASDSYLAVVNTIVILKSTDTKAIMLQIGDKAVFKCRHQYEAVAAVRDYETFDADKLGTWEIDYCRLANPTISAPITND